MFRIRELAAKEGFIHLVSMLVVALVYVLYLV